MSGYTFNPRPNERVISNEPGAVLHRAGDRKRRAALLALQRAEADAKRSDPEQEARRAVEATRAARGRLEGALGDAMARVQDIRSHEIAIAADRDRARLDAANHRDPADARSSMLEAARHDRMLSQLPAMKFKASADVEAARAALARFDEAAAARASQVAAQAATEGARRAALEEKAMAAGEAAYAAVMAGEDARG